MAISQSEGSRRMLKVTVVRADNLKYHQFHGYYVECSIDDQTRKTKTAKPTKKDNVVEWNEAFSFTVDVTSKLLLIIFLKNPVLRDEEKGGAEIQISGIQTDKDISFPLSKNRYKSQQTAGSITLRFSWRTKNEVLTDVVHGTSDALDASKGIASRSGGLDKANATIASGKKVVSVVQSWEFLVASVELFNTIVTELSDIHPYAKAALSIVKGVSGTFVAQIKRDDKIVDLVGTMNDTYELLEVGEPLHDKKLYENLLRRIALQTIECGYFIQAYLRDGFFKRTLNSLHSHVDKAIDNYQAQFTDLKSSLESQTSLDTAIHVYRIMDTVKDIGATINLNEITYAEGMRFSLESCCLPETRKEILDDIIKWANDTETENRVFLLTGLAGSGKSSIAHSVAAYFKSLDRLGSSFFCTRSNLVNCQPDKIFSTIARDLADQNEQIQQKLIEVVKMNKSLGTTRSVREQFQDLIKKATDGLTMIGPLVIVIDALDECEGDDRLRRELMRILAQEASTLPKNFRIFLTSRSSDMHVEDAFGMNSSVVLKGVVHRELLERVPQESTNHDISIFIGEELSGVASGWIERYPNWQAILTSEAGGLFIYASTACKFIRGNSNNRGTHPIERYERLQKARSVGPNTGGGESLKGVYELYSGILMSTFNPNDAIVMSRFKTVLGMVVTAYTTLSTDALDVLLNRASDGRIIVSELGSLLMGWDDPKLPVQVLHASFPDYLSNRDYSSYFYIDDKYRHSQMALLCLKLMNKELKVNICKFQDVHVLYKAIPPDELEKRTREHISEALQYACRHWVTHVVRTDPIDPHYNSIKDALHEFILGGTHLIQWVEVVSLTKTLYFAVRSMRALYDWTKKRVKEDDPVTHQLIYDCYHFLESFAYPILLGPLHVYLSALPYVPTRTALYHLYSRISGLEPIVVFEPKENQKWSFLRSRLSMNGKIKASAFSSDGTLVVCMVKSGEIQVFDFATSVPRGDAMQLKTGRKSREGNKQNNNEDEEGGENEGDVDGDGGESLYYNNATIAISPNCSKIAVSHPKAIEVRDIRNGAYIHREVEFGINDMKIPIVFQSDGVVIACRPNGTSVDIWRYELDNMKASVCAFAAADEVECVALSPNGIYAGCVSSKHTVSVWNVDTKEEIAQFDVPGKGEVKALGLSSSGSYVAVAYGEQIAMWSRGSVIWDKESGYFYEIMMPLSTECSHFVTSGYWTSNLVWDMTTGESCKHESGGDAALAISLNGQFLVTEKGAIYSVDTDKEGPDWEPSSDTEAHKPHLEEGEQLRHVIVSPSGNVAAGLKEETVFVWDRLEADAVKQLLKAHAYVYDVRITPDGLKLASRDEDNKILVWTRPVTGAIFEQPKEHKLKDKDAAENFLYNPSQWGASKDLETSDMAKFSALAYQTEQPLNSGDVKSDSLSAEPSTEGTICMYKRNLEWVTTVGGRKLWWLPEDFRERFKPSSQSGHRLIIYKTRGSASAVIYDYIDNVCP